MKELRDTAVTPDDVLRAAQIEHARWCRDNPAEAKPWDEFAASFKSKQRRGLWSQWVPVSLSAEDYADLAPDDAALCLKVAAVAHAVQFPPD